MTFALPGTAGDYAVQLNAPAFVHQELVEILYHTLWESVHVYFEHRELGLDAGPAGFLYPFLGRDGGASADLDADVARSIVAKAADVERLREDVAGSEAAAIVAAAAAIGDRLRRGGKLILFGNGGSATDANDWAIDCVDPPDGYRPVPAISLAHEPATVTAIANDVGNDLIYLRQLVAHARPADVAVAISTSGGSKNIVAALEEARKRGLLTVALLGYDGGEIGRRGLADRCIVVRSDYIPRIQEVQASVYHVIRELLEAEVHA
jgi:D-sedoheptulose 7-phosphate isomerase